MNTPVNKNNKFPADTKVVFKPKVFAIEVKIVVEKKPGDGTMTVSFAVFACYHPKGMKKKSFS